MLAIGQNAQKQAYNMPACEETIFSADSTWYRLPYGLALGTNLHSTVGVNRRAKPPQKHAVHILACQLAEKEVCPRFGANKDYSHIYIYTYSIYILQRKMSQVPGACRYHCCF